jgi:hypothetical protein
MKAQMSWTPIYLVIILAIAVILITAVVKPMFQSAGDYAVTGLGLIPFFFA